MKRIMNKKAMAQQVFLYILTLIILATIFIFGFKAVNNLRGKSEQAELVAFSKEIKDDVSSMLRSLDEGRRSYSVPAAKICFLDMGYTGDKGGSGLCTNGDPVLCEIWKSGADKNVYLDNEKLPSFRLDDITIEQGFLCKELEQGRLELNMKGTGDKVVISSRMG